MGTKKKPVKKSKSKSKKHAAAKHVERNANQEVPELSDDELEPTEHAVGNEVGGEECSVTPVVEPEKVEEEAMQVVPDEPVDDQTVPSQEEKPIEPQPECVPLCHQRVERLKQSECGIGGRNSVRRKLSLQAPSETAKQDTRRVSLADIKQLKHPLQDSWMFWYYMGIKTKQWNENLRQVYTVATVEDFWCLYNELICPSQLTPGKDFSFFKKHIRPEWEDTANRRGGMWSFCPRDKNHKSSDMDKIWLEVLMFLIGDQFDTLSKYVNGVSYSKRKAQDRISLWIGADITKTDEILKIGHALKRAVSYVTQSFKLEYSTSDDWKQKSGSVVFVRHSL